MSFDFDAISKTPLEGSSVAEEVAKLWKDNNGWIPGAQHERLAEILGLPAGSLARFKDRIQPADHIIPRVR